MLAATAKQKQIIAILTKGDKDLKASLVQSITNDDSKTSTNDLTHSEANEIIYHLGGKPISYYPNWGFFDKANAQHRQILSLCISYGWSVTPTKRKASEIADLTKLNDWLRNNPKCPVHKPLKQMEPKELSQIILALEAMVNWKYKTQ